jgi:hypothetical protein
MEDASVRCGRSVADPPNDPVVVAQLRALGDALLAAALDGPDGLSEALRRLEARAAQGCAHALALAVVRDAAGLLRGG